MAATLQMIPFDEVVEGATVRFTILDDTQYLSTTDLIQHLCSKDTKQAGRIWRNLRVEHKEELQQYVVSHTFVGQRQAQAVITFPGALTLALFLSCESTKRCALVAVLCHFYSGNLTLLIEIEAREALRCANDSSNGSITKKRQLLELEDFELNVLEKRMRINSAAQMHFHVEKEAGIAAIFSFQNLMGSLSSDVNLDGSTRLALKDMAKTNFFNKRNMKRITNTHVNEDPNNEDEGV